MPETVTVPMFDTRRAVEDLVTTGMPPEQAGAVVRMQAQWVDRSFATGEDVERLRTDVNGLREDMDRLRGDLEAKIEAQGVGIGKDMAWLREDMERLRGDLEAKIETQGVGIAKDMARLREDMERLRGDLEAKIESQGERTAKDMASLRGTLEARILAAGMNTTKWVTGTQVATSAIFMAAVIAALKL